MSTTISPALLWPLWTPAPSPTAAERVNKTQSAVSMHVRRLEEQLGVSLFPEERPRRAADRGRRQARRFRTRDLRIEASALLQIGQKGLAGRVRLGLPDDYAEPFLPAIMEGFTSRHPLVEISVISRGLDRAVGAAARHATSTSRSSPTALPFPAWR